MQTVRQLRALIVIRSRVPAGSCSTGLRSSLSNVLAISDERAILYHSIMKPPVMLFGISPRHSIELKYYSKYTGTESDTPTPRSCDQGQARHLTPSSSTVVVHTRVVL